MQAFVGFASVLNHADGIHPDQGFSIPLELLLDRRTLLSRQTIRIQEEVQLRISREGFCRYVALEIYANRGPTSWNRIAWRREQALDEGRTALKMRQAFFIDQNDDFGLPWLPGLEESVISPLE